MELNLSVKREKLLKIHNEKVYNTEEEIKELYIRLYNEIRDFTNKNKSINILNSNYNFDVEKDEFIIKFEINTTYDNPLNVITDINRFFSYFKIELNSKY